MLPKIFPILLLLSFLLIQIPLKKQEKRSLDEEEKLIQKIEKMNKLGYSKEASQLLEKSSCHSMKWMEWKIKTEIINGNIQKAYDLLMENHAFKERKDLLQNIIHAFMDEKEYAKAYQLIEEIKDPSLDPIRLDLLKKTRLLPIKEVYQKGWYDDLAIVQDDKGFFFVDSSGFSIDSYRYDQIIPLASGFKAYVKEEVVFLDHQGHFSSLEWAKDQKEERRAEAPSFLERKKNNYYFKGNPLLEEDFDFVGPVHPKGVAFAKGKKGWVRIHFLALNG